MNTIKYIGMDVHSATISIAVLNDAGKLVMEATIETQASAVVDFIRGLQGALQVVQEFGIDQLGVVGQAGVQDAVDQLLFGQGVVVHGCSFSPHCRAVPRRRGFLTVPQRVGGLHCLSPRWKTQPSR